MGKWIFHMLACVPLLAASTAWSAEVHGRSSTQFLWFNDIFTEKKQAEVAEYLNLSITNIDKAGKLSIQGYGRATQDVRNGDGLNGRLYYLYADYRDLYDKVDIRLGRQFVNYAAGTALIDGGQIELKKVGPVNFSVMGGRNVFFNLNDEGTSSKDYAFGAAAYLAGFQNTDLELSYFMKFDKDGVARDQVGASFKQYLFDSVKVYGNARFDVPSESFSEVLAGVKYYPTSDLVLTGEWYQSYPTFDSTSIYSIFAVDRYQEAVIRADYTINDKISVNAGYNKQLYGDGGEEADVLEVGCRIRPIEQVQLNLNYDYRNGYGGQLNGGIAELTYQPIKPLELAAGIHYDVYERDRVTGEETARRYWGGAKYKIAQNMSASLRIEDNVNARYKSDWQGRAVFNYDF
ncbi:MAG: hypothetical protein A2X80_08895 [Geobacteraceae bacterium GWB2_52_12]|nr:MAG: hypothetical protein A2X80_08895 [Geobacteraceae bacterium GWB2_52_12]